MRRLRLLSFLFCSLLLLPVSHVLATGDGNCPEAAPPDCFLICGGSAKKDDCGVCDGGNRDKDDCGVCFGNNKDKDDCGICFGNNDDKDECGVCFGDGKDKGCDNECFSGKVVDACGECGGPGKTGCDNQCGSNKRLDECGVCGGDGSSCACQYYAVNNYPNPRGSGTRQQVTTGSATSLSCIGDILANCGSDNITRSEYAPDDCVAFDLYNGRGAFWQEPDVIARGYNWGQLSNLGFYYDSQWVIDSNCQRVNVSPGATCGVLNLRWTVSPISLIMDEDVDIQNVRGVTSFALNPNDSKKYYPWRASSATPLLVWDPERTGVITSGAQLFGNWTFGGKKDAYVPAALNGYDSENTPWRDGFEALGTLDMNRDGRITGAELDGLSLWYDHNKNGISEEGEVVNIHEKDIVSLYYEQGEVNEATGDISLHLGYERVVNHEVVTGASVDWYSEGYDTAHDAITAMMIQNMAIKEDVHVPSTSDDTLEGTPLSRYDMTRTRGAWVWEWKDKSRINATGLFLMKEIEGHMRIASVIEVPLKSNQESLKSVMMWNQGVVTVDSMKNFEFKLKGNDGNITTSTFKLSKDGQTLEGRSVWKPSPEMASVEYEWIAKKKF